jgi:hypothetical protein
MGPSPARHQEESPFEPMGQQLRAQFDVCLSRVLGRKQWYYKPYYPWLSAASLLQIGTGLDRSVIVCSQVSSPGCSWFMMHHV